MVSVVAHTFIDLMDLTSFDHETAEKIIDMAVDCLNLYAQLDMSNMAGTAGSKTLNVSSQQKAAIMIAARGVYYGFYAGLSNTSVMSINVTKPADLLGNTTVLDSVREAARLLQEPDYSRAFLR